MQVAFFSSSLCASFLSTCAIQVLLQVGAGRAECEWGLRMASGSPLFRRAWVRTPSAGHSGDWVVVLVVLTVLAVLVG